MASIGKGEAWAIVAARRGSKRLPNKNILPLAGHSLLAYSIHGARQARMLNRIIVNSEDDEILAIGQHYGAEPDRRPDRLASDDATAVQVLTDFVHRHEAGGGAIPEFLLLLQPTCPFRPPHQVDAVVETLRADPHADCCFGVSPIRLPLVDLDGDQLVLAETSAQRSQEMKPLYKLNGLHFGYRVETTIARGEPYGPRVRYLLESDESFLVNIDTEGEFRTAHAFLEAWPDCYPRLPVSE